MKTKFILFALLFGTFFAFSQAAEESKTSTQSASNSQNDSFIFGVDGFCNTNFQGDLNQILDRAGMEKVATHFNFASIDDFYTAYKANVDNALILEKSKHNKVSHLKCTEHFKTETMQEFAKFSQDVNTEASDGIAAEKMKFDKLKSCIVAVNKLQKDFKECCKTAN